MRVTSIYPCIGAHVYLHKIYISGYTSKTCIWEFCTHLMVLMVDRNIFKPKKSFPYFFFIIVLYYTRHVHCTMYIWPKVPNRFIDLIYNRVILCFIICFSQKNLLRIGGIWLVTPRELSTIHYVKKGKERITRADPEIRLTSENR